MGNTRINSRLVGDGQVNTIDLADGAVTSVKMTVGACTGNRIKVGDGNKGDMMVSDASANNVTLPVGADGTVLTADSGETVGLKWAAPVTAKLFSSITNSNVYNTSTAETQFDQLGTVPANTLKAGDVIHLRFSGGYIQASGTITLRVYIGTSNFLDFGAFTPTTTGAERGFTAEVSIVVGTIGSSGTVRGTAVLTFNGQTPVVKVSGADFSVDTTADKDLKMTAQWSASSASNSILLRAVDMEIFR